MSDVKITAACCANCGERLPPAKPAAPLQGVPRAGVPTLVLRTGELLERCPVCDFPVVASLAGGRRPTSVDDQGTINRDVFCRRCGYNLRGLSPVGVCPECATPAEHSLRVDLLCFANPRYVRRLARGGTCLTVGTGMTGFATCFTILAIALVVGGVTFAGSDALGAAPFLLLGLAAGMAAIGSVVCLVGVWLSTGPERDSFNDQHRVTPRRVVRICLALGFFGFVLNGVVTGLTPPVPVMAAFSIVSLGFWAAGVVGVRAYFRHLARLCERIPDQAKARRARSLAKSLTTALAALLFIAAVNTLLLWGPALLPGVTAPVLPQHPMDTESAWLRAWWVVRTAVTSVAWLAVVVLFLRTIHLHWTLPELLTRQARLAEQRHTPPATTPIGTAAAPPPQ